MAVIPVPSGASEASKLLQQIQKQSPSSGPGASSFAKTLQQNVQAHATAPSSGPSPVEMNKLQKTPSAIKSLFNTWSKDQNSMHKIMKIAMSGQTFSPGQLIMLQQATYKVTFELETMSKLVEQASSAVKTTMQTQI